MRDYLAYQKSISDELLSEKNRVRNIIGNSHYGEEGRYKEIILKELIATKLPGFAKVGTGFVAGDELTKQIDIIIYRDDIPMIFQKADFLVAPKEAVLGIIEVKTKWASGSFAKEYERAHDNGLKIGKNIFNGIFFYDCEKQFTKCPRCFNVCEKNGGYVNNISFGPDYFFKYWGDGKPNRERGEKYRLYEIKKLSFGYFVSNLIEDVYLQVQGQSIPNTVSNMMYPIENTKESHIVDTIPVI